MKSSKLVRVNVNKANRQRSIVLPIKLGSLPERIKPGEELMVKKESLSNLEFVRRQKKK